MATLSTTQNSTSMTTAFTRASAAISQAKSIEDFNRADVEAILSLKLREFLEDFDTVKAYCLNKVNPDEDDRTGASLKSGIDAGFYGLDELNCYADAIRTGEVHSWG